MEEGRSSSTIETTEAKVKSIFVYPIKSCRGISLSQAPAPLTPTGSSMLQKDGSPSSNIWSGSDGNKKRGKYVKERSNPRIEAVELISFLQRK
ncbi:hypothetical protein LguiB_009134 [Lonicera macranthoides]